MIDNNLIAYIEQNLKKGYGISPIQNALIKQGYSTKNVLDTINYVQGNKQGVQNASVQTRSPSKKRLFILIPIVLVIIIGVSIFLFTNFSSKSISEEEFSQGTSVNLQKDTEVNFNLNEEVHTLKIDSVSDSSVSLTIQSNPIKVDIKIGEENKLDLDNDGFYDIKIRLNNIIDGIPDLFIQKIHESTCVENWNCGVWSDCTEQGTQSRTCTDTNTCGTSKNKPTTTQSCPYVKPCIEDWDCGSWSKCKKEGTQTRVCRDKNQCGTEKQKPVESQICCYWTCGEWSEGCSASSPKQLRECTWKSNCAEDEIPATERDCEPNTSENPCYPYICSNIQDCVEGICVTKTCSELGGVLCPSPENTCSGDLWGLDEGSCCIGTCTPQDSCDSLGGIFCKDTLCEGDSIETYDSPSKNVCCVGTCHTGECGETAAQTAAQQYIDALANNDYDTFVSLVDFNCTAVMDVCKAFNCPEDNNTYESTCQDLFESDRTYILSYSSIDFYREIERDGYSHVFFDPVLNGEHGSVTIECQKNYLLGGCRVVSRFWYTNVSLEFDDDEDEGLKCEEETNPIGRDMCYRAKATANNDPSYCEKIQDADRKQACIDFLS